jgi:methyl-accepting chemotaxis protein
MQRPALSEKVMSIRSTLTGASIYGKLLLPLVSAFVLVLGALTLWVGSAQKDALLREAEASSEQTAQLVAASVRELMAADQSARVPTLVAAVSASGSIDAARVVPSAAIAAETGASGPPPDEVEQRVLASGEDLALPVEAADGHPQIRRVLPIRSDASCTGCHESKEGEVLAVVSLHQSLAAPSAAVAEVRTGLVFGVSFALVALSFLVWLVARRTVVLPVQEAAATLQDIAEGAGDLTRRLADASRDEVGALAGAFNTFAGRLQEMVQGIAGVAGRLYAASQELSFTAGDLSRDGRTLEGEASAGAASAAQASAAVASVVAGAADTASQVGQVATAADRINGDVARVADGARELAGTVSSVAGAVEEMSASLGEVASNCARAATASATGNEKARDARQEMQRLAETAVRIGRIVELIDDIADQTNLLALNATIEAASAGEAGRGFAVVAGEVKALARQTAEATEEISRQVQAIQADARAAESRIGAVADLIDEVSGLTGGIAAAVEEQSATIDEIARNVAATAAQAESISGRVADMASGVDQVARGAARIREASERTAQATGEMAEGVRGASRTLEAVSATARAATGQAEGVDRASQDVVGIAGELTEIVRGYRYSDRKFDALAPVAAHRGWLTRLSGLLSGRLSLRPEDVGSHRDCEFGQWYFGEGQSELGKARTFREIDPLHARIHTDARRIAEFAQAGRRADAEQLLAALKPVSAELAEKLERLEAESGSGSAARAV